MSITKLIAELDSAADNLAVIGNHGVDVVNHQAICMQVAKRLNDLEKSLEGMVLVPRERLEKIAGFWDVTMRATDNDMARLMYDASCIAKGMLSIAEEAE